eukprot:m.23582 g.23582  ORF g.23582 m.23582 type:complete len:65 (+) comp9424_c0_seq1:131-325(+)
MFQDIINEFGATNPQLFQPSDFDRYRSSPGDYVYRQMKEEKPAKRPSERSQFPKVQPEDMQSFY